MSLPDRDIHGQDLREITINADGVCIYDRENDQAWVECDPAPALEDWR